MKRGSTAVTTGALDAKSLVVTVGGKRVSRVKVLEERCAELLGQIR